VPAYVVFPDATLIEMARVRPSSLDQMRQISGVGPRKLEQFGPLFLAVTRSDDRETVAPVAAFDRP
jgi:ATP-dependent DNA helicase RecQ